MPHIESFWGASVVSTIARIGVVSLATFLLFEPITDAQQTQTRMLSGQCTTDSFIAKGRTDEDLSKGPPYFCDTATVISFSDFPQHRFLQFANSRSRDTPVLGFDGLLDEVSARTSMMAVRFVYLEKGRRSAPSDKSTCFVNYDSKSRQIRSITCGARVTEGGQSTAAVVGFEVK